MIYLHNSPLFHKNWKFCLAYEIVEHWQKSSLVNKLKLDPLINLNELDNCSALQLSLKLKIQSAKLSANSVEDIEQAEIKIKQFFNEIRENLRSSLRASGAATFQTFQREITTNYRDLSPNALSNWLLEQAEFLSERADFFEAETVHYSRKASSAELACFRLTQELRLATKHSREYLTIETSVWNALSLYFEFKLKAENYKLLTQTALSLLRFCQINLDSVRRSLAILEQILVSLRTKGDFSSISHPVFTDLKTIDADQPKKILESWIGHPLNYWGDSPVSWQQIEAKLLSSIKPITAQIFQSEFSEIEVFENPT